MNGQPFVTTQDRLELKRNRDRFLSSDQAVINKLVESGVILNCIKGLQKWLRHEENGDARDLLNYLLLYINSNHANSADMKWQEAENGHRYN